MSALTTATYKLYTLAEKLSMAEQRKNASDSYYSPIESDFYKRLREGSLVKVSAYTPQFSKPCEESFWVIINRTKGNEYEGTINNQLQRTQFHNLKLGDVIRFHKKHILSIGVIA